MVSRLLVVNNALGEWASLGIPPVLKLSLGHRDSPLMMGNHHLQVCSSAYRDLLNQSLITQWESTPQYAELDKRRPTTGRRRAPQQH